MSVPLFKEPLRRKIYFLLLLVASIFLALVALWIPFFPDPSAPSLKEGMVAQHDYRAPAAITYESVVLTEQRRDAAERAVLPIYTLPDTRLARQQLERLRVVLAYINSVRSTCSGYHLSGP